MIDEQGGIEVSLISFPDLLRDLAADGTEIALVKMDIEGVEYDVIQQICDQGLVRSIGQLLVEFHHYFPGLEASSTQRAVRQLKECGFGIAWISRTNREYLFVRK